MGVAAACGMEVVGRGEELYEEGIGEKGGAAVGRSKPCNKEWENLLFVPPLHSNQMSNFTEWPVCFTTLGSLRSSEHSPLTSILTFLTS